MDGSDLQVATNHEMRSALAIVRGAAAILAERGIDPERWNQAGYTPPYAEKTRTGLQILDCRATQLFIWARHRKVVGGMADDTHVRALHRPPDGFELAGSFKTPDPFGNLLYVVGPVWLGQALISVRTFAEREGLEPDPLACVATESVALSAELPLLAAEGQRVAVLSRGYKRSGGPDRLLVSDGRSLLAGAHESGDEPLLIARRCPQAIVAVGSDRAALGRWVLEQHPVDCIILDDGFQHWSLHRDVDVVLVAQKEAGGGGPCQGPADRFPFRSA